MSKKVAVLGLDGVPFTLLEHLFAAGVMPHLAGAARSRAFVPMDTALPAVSSVAWASFMTGENPGRHGIFGFTDVAGDEISLRLPSFDDLRAPAIWQKTKEKASVVVNLPFTYPARPLRGVLIAGFVAPIFERAVYPEALIPWLKSRNYRTDADCVRGRQDRKFLLRDLFETLGILEEVVLDLMEREPWELFIAVVTGTDRLNHFFFDAAADPGHPYHSDFLSYYSRVDTFCGRFLERLGPGTRLFVLSDHGFTPLAAQVYLNPILRNLGYLSFRRPDPTTVEDIDPSSRAFALDPTRIYLNTRDRFRGGVLSSGEAAEIRERLKNRLEQMTLADAGISAGGVTGSDEPLFAAVRYKEEIYSGEMLPQAPDLVVIPRPGYDPKAAVNVTSVTMKDIFTGMHPHDDAFRIADDPSLASRIARPSIAEAGRLVQDALR